MQEHFAQLFCGLPERTRTSWFQGQTDGQQLEELLERCRPPWDCALPLVAGASFWDRKWVTCRGGTETLTMPGGLELCVYEGNVGAVAVLEREDARGLHQL